MKSDQKKSSLEKDGITFGISEWEKAFGVTFWTQDPRDSGQKKRLKDLTTFQKSNSLQGKQQKRATNSGGTISKIK